MTSFSRTLQAAQKNVRVQPPASRPRILMGADEVAQVRKRATPAFADALAKQAQAAAQNELLFGKQPEIPYLCQPSLRALSHAAFLLQDERAAARALEGVEIMFSFPAEEWVARPHRPMRCDHAMLNVAATIGIAMDLCAPFWGADTLQSIGARIREYTVARFLETWEKKDAHWARLDYHWNWKIMCCGEMGTAALSCAEQMPELPAVLDAALAGCLDILDFVPPEGDWPEGAGYWLGTLGFGLRFGLALCRATGGAVDLFEHPALKKTGDYIVHLTEPDGQVYDFNDNGRSLGAGLDYLLLLARRHQRGDWARTARASNHTTVERLAWDDPALADAIPEQTAQCYPTTGVALMRSSWDENATFIGFKSASSAVGHSQLDANSFVVTARGQRLLLDEGIWPYAHFLGFFDNRGPRFNFDANGTIGHSTLMVDGQGQIFGAAYSGKIASFAAGKDIDMVTGDATEAYGGKLSRYLRTLAFVKPDILLVYDRVAADEPHFLEWLFHHRADVSGDETRSTFSQNGVMLTMRRILPADAQCWRTSDVTRSSAYTESNGNIAHRVEIRYRSFGPFHPCKELDVLWAIHVGNPEHMPNIEASASDGVLQVRLINRAGKTQILALK